MRFNYILQRNYNANSPLLSEQGIYHRLAGAVEFGWRHGDWLLFSKVFEK